MNPDIKAFFHQASFTLTYIVSCPQTRMCAIIDPALDFDPVACQVSSEFSDELINYIKDKDLKLAYILETHAHADHISSATYIKSKLGGEIGISTNIKRTQSTFKVIFNMAKQINESGQHFDRLLREGDNLTLGALNIDILETPGHTPDSITFVIGKHAFIGDTLFMPDSGSARCDFPGGDARLLYSSIQKLYALGDDTCLYMCHDYQPQGRELAFHCTVAEQKQANIQVREGIDEQDYVKVREERDATLANPKLIFPSLQCNIQAGKLPSPEDNGQVYFKLPVKVA
ncbi:MBL fold metallo-hydrolase [Thalassotalea sp. PS06]|uniref:MBL fold metallo-hydrolase n=1 Tax=Thalassotalea sp. PS06 TaxID=2594005 RepID=UPI001161F7F9|nr:MBL fold metallo-hydrolase [Thalassotalea sp. PS06]QDP01075.1 MBL fold metallo-hydrolase [Thalassotalea sp. PS06]